MIKSGRVVIDVTKLCEKSFQAEKKPFRPIKYFFAHLGNFFVTFP